MLCIVLDRIRYMRIERVRLDQATTLHSRQEIMIRFQSSINREGRREKYVNSQTTSRARYGMRKRRKESKHIRQKTQLIYPHTTPQHINSAAQYSARNCLTSAVKRTDHYRRPPKVPRLRPISGYMHATAVRFPNVRHDTPSTYTPKTLPTPPPSPIPFHGVKNNHNTAV